MNAMEESVTTVPAWAYTPQKRSVSTNDSFFQVNVNLNYVFYKLSISSK